MKLIHTSDWHLGRWLHGVDLLEYQSTYLDQLVELARDVKPAAVLVSGDIYDRAVPPVGAVELLRDALERLTEVTTVVITSGNHDSAARLGFGAALMRPELRLVTRLDQVGQPVELPGPGGSGGALVYPIPYLDVFAAQEAWTAAGEPWAPGGELARSHEAVLSAAVRAIQADLSRRGLGGAGGSAGEGRPATVVMAHAFVVGASPSDSERELTVGGIGTVPASVFSRFDYAALGHIHRPQEVRGGAGQVLNYPGSPLAFSFSEAGHVKSTSVVTLGSGPPQLERIPAPVPRALAEVHGSLEQLESAAHDEFQSMWVSVTVTDTQFPQDMYRRVRHRFPHALLIRHEPSGAPADPRGRVVTARSDPVEVAASFLEYAGGRAASAAEIEEVRDALAALAVAGGSP
ncbi:MAG: exonuclease SbcCD subunit D [Bifidobacteriaceae bacterium]|jgi:exonuclease SbcD|nr:exonuclease SbcCD subunit D [Bifidobacteriaceae bacterium]